MGVALAETAVELGAEVTLVLGPGSVMPSDQEIDIIPVVSANEMKKACITLFPECDGAIMAAAVSDFKPEKIHNQKVKRGDDDWIIRLKPTDDIALALGKMKKEGQLLVGFALESRDEIRNARKKLVKKNFDFIVLNSLADHGAGFGYDTNKISILDRDNNIQHFELKSKRDVAKDIMKKVEEYLV